MYGIEQNGGEPHTRLRREENAALPSPVEDRVWQLCAQLTQAANNDGEIERLLPELRRATAEYIQNTRDMAAKVIPRAYGTD
jgi:hypothetical protein